MEKIKKILSLFTPRERKQAVLLTIMLLIMALLDTIGVASILPFIAVLTNPGVIETNSILNTMYIISGNFGVENDQQFLFALGIIVFIFLVVSILFKAFTTYVQLRFVQMREYSIGKRLVEGYLHQPYSWFLDRHSAELGKNILSEAGMVVGGFLKPLIDVIARIMVTIALITLLIIVDPKLALIIGLLLWSICGYFYLMRSFLK